MTDAEILKKLYPEKDHSKKLAALAVKVEKPGKEKK